MNQTQTYIKIAAGFGLTGVLAGAFGAHALSETLSIQQLDWWKTAAFYHLVHSLLLVGIALSLTQSSSIWIYRAFTTTAIGILLFSGSLYLMALTSIRGLALLTPIGGLGLSLGWLCLFMVSKKLLPRRMKGKKDE
jgi:uncharacterized membrane protein YgdD (TMEM256/DUF423 family)